MGAGSRHGFRIAPAVHGETSDADDEDGDDDLNTESDLETHADDDAFEYSANPEEDEEGQHYLRSQLQGVAIKKRSHAQVEDAEEEIEGTHGNDGAVNVEGKEDGSSSQVLEISIPLIQDLKNGNERCSKKARTASSAEAAEYLTEDGETA